MPLHKFKAVSVGRERPSKTKSYLSHLAADTLEKSVEKKKDFEEHFALNMVEKYGSFSNKSFSPNQTADSFFK